MDLDGDGVPRPEDCDDDDPGVTIPVWYLDLDGDGYGGGTSEESCVAPQSYVTETGDCDDDDAAVFPGAEELCNGIDDDCDQDVDEELPEQTWYLDYEGDGYGGSEITEQACGPSSNHVGNADDCDDADPAVSPAAQEVCDADDVDEDCDGLADDTDSSVDTSTQVTVYQDLDGDGYGVEGKTSSACDPGDGWALVAEDCDDSDPALHPDTLWYRDADEDGYGDAAYSVRSCHEVEAYVPNALDCDDGEAAYNPDAQEVCDAADIDEDCDGLVDDADDTVAEQFTIYEDVDGDGYGDDSTETLACDQWSGWVLVGGDCDTADASTNPGAEEIWYDGHDRDCDGWDDYDADYDGYVSDAHSGTDCDDTLPLVNPGMDEACGDELDNDCDGVVAGNCLLEGEISLEEAHAAIYGSNSSDYFGCGFESAGDHDGDGYEDLIVAGKCGFASGAQVSVFEGPFSGASTLSDALCTYVAEPGGESTSVEVSSGDLNNDGQSDLVVG